MVGGGSAPLADRLGRLPGAAPIRNFHALPLSGALREMSPAWRDRFARLGGYAGGVDVSFSSPALDSLFAPEGPLEHAQELAAEAFGAVEALFGTCGTTISNRIVLDALTSNGQRVLIDGASHQSVLFTAGSLSLTPTVIAPLRAEGFALPDINGLEAALRNACQVGAPYDAVALTASSYDGYMIRLEEVIPRLVNASPTTAIMVDAAWTAIHAFSPSMNAYTPFVVVNRMRATGMSLPPIVVTTSAHKSLCALRQASLILVAHGENNIRTALTSSLFKHHTTSPSWPILASLDLARAHSVELGADLFERAVALRNRFVSQLKNDPVLACLVRDDAELIRQHPHMGQDPMKVFISVSMLGDPREVKRSLYNDHGIYVARCSGAGLLLNFTIGVTEEDVDVLIRALRAMMRSSRRSQSSETYFPVGSVIAEYVVPYPPGIPIARPGDIWSHEHVRALDAETAAGAEIFRLPEFALERTYA